MMKKRTLLIFNRKTLALEEEKICAKPLVNWLYKNNSFWAHFFSPLFPLLSKIFALFAKSRFSKSKIATFIEEYKIDKNEFVAPTSSFTSFNDFFIRKLKVSCRPINREKETLISPADGRCLVYPNIDNVDNFCIKGNQFNLESFLKNQEMISKFKSGSMALIRLAPMDYHHFHFPTDAFANTPAYAQGSLFSVNPIALCQNIKILYENKKMYTLLKTTYFGEILFVEIGATLVGTIIQTFQPMKKYKKGEEKGYFSFGGSSIVLLFEKGRINFSKDLIVNSKDFLETKVLFGEPLGVRA